MADLIPHDIVDTNGVGIIWISRLPSDGYILSNGSFAMVISNTDDLSVENAFFQSVDCRKKLRGLPLIP
jgi:hypothetical protein